MDLNNPISSIMTSEVECVSPEQKILDVKHIYQKKAFHHHIPVVEKGYLVGMVSLIDFMRHIADASLDDNEPIYHEKTVRDIMFQSPSSVPSDTSIKIVAEELALGNIHALVVADDDVVKGIVSTADIISYFLGKK